MSLNTEQIDRNRKSGKVCGECKPAEHLDYRFVDWDEEKFDWCESQVRGVVDEIIERQKYKSQDKLMWGMEECVNGTFDIHSGKITANVEMGSDNVMELTFSKGYKARRKLPCSLCCRTPLTDDEKIIMEWNRKIEENKAANGGKFIVDGIEM